MDEEGREKIYGRTINGIDITDELIEYVAEAEAGYDLAKWHPVQREPRFIPAETLTLHLDARDRYVLELRVKIEGRSPEAILTDGLYCYLVQKPWIEARHEGDTGG